jgi:hypothetical protein
MQVLGHGKQEDWSKGSRGTRPWGAGGLGQGDKRTVLRGAGRLGHLEQELGQWEQDYVVGRRRIGLGVSGTRSGRAGNGPGGAGTLPVGAGTGPVRAGTKPGGVGSGPGRAGTGPGGAGTGPGGAGTGPGGAV